MELTDRNSVWGTNSGRIKHKIKICEMNSKHLANTIRWVSDRLHEGYYTKGDLNVLKLEADARGLTDAFLDKAPYPYDADSEEYIKYDPILECLNVIPYYVDERETSAGRVQSIMFKTPECQDDIIILEIFSDDEIFLVCKLLNEAHLRANGVRH